MSNEEYVTKRGLASAPEDTRKRVARAGGDAPHAQRGLQAANWETRRDVARKGGLARGFQRRKTESEHQEEVSSPIT